MLLTSRNRGKLPWLGTCYFYYYETFLPAGPSTGKDYMMTFILFCLGSQDGPLANTNICNGQKGIAVTATSLETFWR